MKAVEADDLDEVKRLLQEESRISEERDPTGRTALHLAVIAENRAAIDVLVDGGFDVDAVDHQGFRAVHFACWDGTYGGRQRTAMGWSRLCSRPALLTVRPSQPNVAIWIECVPS